MVIVTLYTRETLTSLDFAVECKYLSPEIGQELFNIYDEILPAPMLSLRKSKNP
jgi:hypothetical protein